MNASRYGRKSIADKLFLSGELALLCLSSWLASSLYHSSYSPVSLDIQLVNIVIFSAAVMLCALSVGLYDHKLREGHKGIVKRVVITLLFSAILLEFIIFQLFPAFRIGSLYLLWASLIAAVLISAFRAFCQYHDINRISRRRVLVLGAGERASIIERRMRRNVDRRDFEIVGYVRVEGDKSAAIQPQRQLTIDYSNDLFKFVMENKIDQLVIACDERRNMLPVEALFKCKTRGIDIIEILDFIENETGQIAVNLIYPSWIIHSNGLSSNPRFRTSLGYLLNVVLAVSLLLVTWPIMLITALLIYLEDGRKHSVSIFYRQIRVGIDGNPFYILKFRSMRPDAEKNGAQWASANDSRVTRVGQFIRKYRIDELPQLFNVLKGEMGFVGPRPERPEFVVQLAKDIPYYNNRHNVKPGLTGWAQLKYPYGSTAEDAQEKLKFDLYYIKHRSLMLDLVILIRTVEIVLFGRGR
ncbi:TIGR03013 family PEP-CTERM/XrtA system glycosyltransferase [Rheinheimera aquimaris]|uniref:TIGR03013 family XrtA/PEP-CTERM system glycosyltransferase n=1 Tax=Rheinheimera aquimaris TaxID=412437 RepID=UPI001CFF63EB|nr:TIGR03013 family XrtA/PEP-CTERM system glycosyltransferase [Rheinheimera aquimaris]MCB5215255.1 TIGR03013 family PEP-CTERM/XrtA system glycosyltransferase [Rheinheimera aquimaris]